MIIIKTPDELKRMKEGGKISAQALADVLEAVKPGITLSDLDSIASNTISKLGAQASFKTVDTYKYATCLNVNSGIVHGIPNSYKLKMGDLVSIDLGALYKDFHTDLAYTVEVGSSKEDYFLNVGKRALTNAINNCMIGNHLGDISHSIQEEVEKAGYSVSRELVGHGVGKELHEDPYVPGYGKRGKGPLLKEGMVLAIEVIYQKGRPDIVVDPDNWTIRTADGSLSGLFEHTVAITQNGPEILTQI